MRQYPPEPPLGALQAAGGICWRQQVGSAGTIRVGKTLRELHTTSLSQESSELRLAQAAFPEAKKFAFPQACAFPEARSKLGFVKIRRRRFTRNLRNDSGCVGSPTKQ